MREQMGCPCKQVFGDRFYLTPICIGKTGIFENLGSR